MKGRKKTTKGISTIIGSIFLIQIIAVSVVLFLYVVNNETYTVTHATKALDNVSQFAVLMESYSNNKTYVVTTSPIIITHVIYPNGTVTNTSIVVKYNIPASAILSNQKWAVIVTNEGTWFNVTPINVITITLNPP